MGFNSGFKGLIAPCVGGVEQRKIPQPTFYMRVTLWLHLDMHIWIPSFWIQRMLKSLGLGPYGTSVKEQGSLDLASD